MTTTTALDPATAEVAAAHGRTRTASARIPLTRLVGVELRTMFDTRSGFWLMASIVIASVLATAAIIVFAPDDQQTYDNFAAAIGAPMTIILPMIGILAVTSEWSQRSGLTTFTLVPRRGRVMLAKAVAAWLVALGATAVAFLVGSLGNLVGAPLAGIAPVWDQGLADVGYFAIGNTLLMMIGFTLGALIRTSAGAVVAYMVYAFVAPGLLAFLAFNQDWFRDVRPWVDPKYNQDALQIGRASCRERVL